MKKIFAVLVISLLSACASDNAQQTSDVEDHSYNRGGESDGMRNGAGSDGFGMNPLQDPNNILSRRSVYFDFDSYTVKSEYRDLVLAHASYTISEIRCAKARNCAALTMPLNPAS